MSRWEPDAKGRLQRAAMTLFLERGYAEVTVADITKRAGLTKRSFFNHFVDKREVLFADADAFLLALTSRWPRWTPRPIPSRPQSTRSLSGGPLAGQLQPSRGRTPRADRQLDRATGAQPRQAGNADPSPPGPTSSPEAHRPGPHGSQPRPRSPSSMPHTTTGSTIRRATSLD